VQDQEEKGQPKGDADKNGEGEAAKEQGGKEDQPKVDDDVGEKGGKNEVAQEHGERNDRKDIAYESGHFLSVVTFHLFVREVQASEQTEGCDDDKVGGDALVPVLAAKGCAGDNPDALLDAALAKNLAECCVCLRKMPAGDMKQLSKSRMECNACQRVDLAINRKVGSTQWLRQLEPSAQADFYLAAHTMPPSKMVDLVATHQTTISKKKTSPTSSSGTFLPLKEWQSKGFDVDVAALKPDDKRSHPVLGETVRVCIDSEKEESQKSIEETMQLLASQRRQTKAKGSSRASDFEDAPAPMLGDVDESESEASEGSTSSSSSSSSDKKKGKKSKKAKKDTKKRKVAKKSGKGAKEDKEAKKAEKELQARQKKATKDASKLGEGIKKIHKSLANGSVIFVPAVTLDPIRDAVLAATRFQDALVAFSHGAGLPPSGDASSHLKGLTWHCKKLDQVLSIVSKGQKGGERVGTRRLTVLQSASAP